MIGKSFKYFDPPTTKWRPFHFFFVKLNGNHILMTNFSKLRNYQIFGLMELHNLSKGQLADRIFKLWKSCVYDYRAVEQKLLKFWLFNFSNFQTTFVKNFMKKLPGFKTDFESTDKVLRLRQYLWSEISQQWNNSPLNFFWNLHGRALRFLNLSNKGNIKTSILLILLL